MLAELVQLQWRMFYSCQRNLHGSWVSGYPILETSVLPTLSIAPFSSFLEKRQFYKNLDRVGNTVKNPNGGVGAI